LRVIGGSARGRIMRHPRGTKIRPTSDRVKEALFNILADKTRGAVVLDLFAGTGALGIEALSRGAIRAVFVDRHRDSINLVRSNLILTGLLPCAELYRQDAVRALSLFQRQGRSFDLVLLDPPYKEGITLSTLGQLAQSGVLSLGGIVAVEHSCQEDLPERVADLQLWRQRRYGDTVLSFYIREV
jgi:16S rRNA (guanine966-N2)-methyltransferase